MSDEKETCTCLWCQQSTPIETVVGECCWSEWKTEILDLRAKLQEAEAESLLWEERAMEAGYAHAAGGYKPEFVESLQAEVARLTQRDHREIDGCCSKQKAELRTRIAELEALAAENDAAYRIWRRRCEATDSRIAELEAELLGALREKEDVRRTATEAALRWVLEELRKVGFIVSAEFEQKVLDAGARALLGGE